MTKYIEKEWDEFRKTCIPDEAPDIQVREMRRAFYAGAAAFLATTMQFLEPGVEPTEADMQRMDGVFSELQEFMKDVKRGDK